jgi:hypothetical protein
LYSGSNTKVIIMKKEKNKYVFYGYLNDYIPTKTLKNIIINLKKRKLPQFETKVNDTNIDTKTIVTKNT